MTVIPICICLGIAVWTVSARLLLVALPIEALDLAARITLDRVAVRQWRLRSIAIAGEHPIFQPSRRINALLPNVLHLLTAVGISPAQRAQAGPDANGNGYSALPARIGISQRICLYVTEAIPAPGETNWIGLRVSAARR